MNAMSYAHLVWPPALVAGMILAAFISGQYWWERRKRRRFRQVLEGNQSQSRSERLPDAALEAGYGNAGSGRQGVGTPPDENEAFPSFAQYFLDHLGHYALAVCFVCVALVVRLLLESALRDHVPYGFFLLAVVATALATDIWETCLALVVGFVMAAYFFIEPVGFRISSPDAWWGAAIYFATGLGILWFMKSEHTAWLRALDRDIAYFDRLKELDQERTARKQATNDRAILASIVESAQDAVLSVTLQGRITTWNAAAERLLGYSARETVGQPITLIFPPDHAALPKGLLDQINRGQQTEPLQAALCCKGGSSAEVSLTFWPVNDGAGKLIGASVIARSGSSKPFVG
jgi:PAS domain S-box-containing protein